MKEKLIQNFRNRSNLKKSLHNNEPVESNSLIERAAEAGVGEAFLEVRPSNTAAIRLYQSLGFEQVGMRRGYYQAASGREDAVVLKRVLRPGAAAG